MENAFAKPPAPPAAPRVKKHPGMDAVLDEAIRRAREALDPDASPEEVTRNAPDHMLAAEQHLTNEPVATPAAPSEE